MRDRIGGKHSLSLLVFLIGSPLWIFGLTLNEPVSFESTDGFLTVFALSTLGQVGMGLTLWLAHLSVGRGRAKKPVSITVLAIVWSASAAVRILIIVGGMEIFSLTNTVPLWNRVIVSILMATLGYAVGSYALDAVDRFRDERAQLLRQLLESEEQLSSHRTAVSTMKSELINRVDQKLGESREHSTKSLDQLERALLDRADARPALDELRGLSDATWKRISSEVWQNAPLSAPRIRAREFLTLYAGSGPFRLGLLALTAPFLFALIYSRVFDYAFGLVITFAWLGGALSLGLVANEVLKKLKTFVLPALGVAVLAMVFSSLPILALGEALGTSPAVATRVISVHAIAMIFVALTSVPSTVTLARESVLKNLQKYMDDATLEKLHVESQLAIVAQKIASQLHGDVRGNFLASVLNLQRHIDEGHTEEALEAISKLRVALAKRLDVASEDSDSAEALTQFISNWSAILDISLENPLLNVPAEFLPAVHTVVVDAINNAVRHGDADWVRVGFTLEPDAVVLNIRENGNGRASARVGMGTLHLNQLAPEKWSRFTNDQGIVQLVVRLEREHLGAVSGRV
jgi:signal transduction histidine kinase